MKGSPQTEIIGGNIYTSDIESYHPKSVFTPTVSKLVCFNKLLDEDQLYWHSSLKKKSNEDESLKQKNQQNFQRVPLGEIRQQKEEDKYNVYFSNTISEASNSHKLSKKSKLTQKRLPEYYDKADNNSNQKSLKSCFSSDFFIKPLSGYQSDTRPNKSKFWDGWKTKISRKRFIKKIKKGEKVLDQNHEQFYKTVIKEVTDENEDLRHVISGLNQQINELRLEVNDREEAIEELTEAVNILQNELAQK